MSALKLAVSNLSPGSGKTTTALNLAAALARTGKTVLLVDGDPKNPFHAMGGLSDSGVAIDRESQQVLRTSPVSGLSVLCGFGSSLAKGPNAEHRERFRKVSAEFDWVIFDAPSERGPALDEILKLTDDVIIPVQNHVSSYDQLPAALHLLVSAKKANPRLAVKGLVVTMTHPKNEAAEPSAPAARATYEAIVDQYRSMGFDTQVPLEMAVADAMGELAPVGLKDPQAPAAQIFANLATEVSAKCLQAAPAAVRRVAVRQDKPIPIAREIVPTGPPVFTGAPAAARNPLTTMLRWITNLFGGR